MNNIYSRIRNELTVTMRFFYRSKNSVSILAFLELDLEG